MAKWNADPNRAELLAVYNDVDELLAPYSCEASAECCDFANTGREPQPTTIELAEVLHASRTTSALNAKRRRLPLATGSRRCPLLGDDGRCRIYASRPFGCRTFFCERMTGPGKLPRREIQALSRRIADLSERAFPRDPWPRPLSGALAAAKSGDPGELLARRR